MKELDDDLLKKLIQQLPEDSPSEGFTDRIMQRIEKKSIFVIFRNWIIQKQSNMVLNITNHILNNTQNMINDYNKMILIEV